MAVRKNNVNHLSPAESRTVDKLEGWIDARIWLQFTPNKEIYCSFQHDPLTTGQERELLYRYNEAGWSIRIQYDEGHRVLNVTLR